MFALPPSIAAAPLPRAFYARPTLDVARELVGQLLVCGERQGRIVETEAYIGQADRACHAFHGHTKRTEVLFGPAGHAYIYLVYGMHHCLNVVTEAEGTPGAVLIRAAEPLGRGPGVLCRELGLTRAHNGLDLTAGSELRILAAGCFTGEVQASPRIGVDYAGEWAAKPWRFTIPGNRWVSGPRSTPHRRT
ncbi:MAG: DNA-3-methyladenine glycosylase [Chloroflexota bacterium]